MTKKSLNLDYLKVSIEKSKERISGGDIPRVVCSVEVVLPDDLADAFEEDLGFSLGKTVDIEPAFVKDSLDRDFVSRRRRVEIRFVRGLRRESSATNARPT